MKRFSLLRLFQIIYKKLLTFNGVTLKLTFMSSFKCEGNAEKHTILTHSRQATMKIRYTPSNTHSLILAARCKTRTLKYILRRQL